MKRPWRTPLWKIWDNLKARIAGRHTDGAGVARWKGLEKEWQSFAEFRDWALASGYTDGASLDRKESHLGYTRSNCQWLTFEENRAKARASHKPMCKCFCCKNKRAKEGVDDSDSSCYSPAPATVRLPENIDETFPW